MTAGARVGVPAGPGAGVSAGASGAPGFYNHPLSSPLLFLSIPRPSRTKGIPLLSFFLLPPAGNDQRRLRLEFRLADAEANAVGVLLSSNVHEHTLTHVTRALAIPRTRGGDE